MAVTTTKSQSLFLALLFLLFISHALLSAKAHRCAPFSCGQLHDVSYHFRRRDDPPQCGKALYQFNCQGNKSTIFIGSMEYSVTDIQYENIGFYVWKFHQIIISLVDQNFVSGGSCDLPSQSLSTSTLISLGKWLNPGLWASFMNCSRPIKQHDSRYWPVSCPMRYNSTYVYVAIAEDGFELKYLPPSCEFISMIPVKDSMVSLNSAADALSILQQSFDLTHSQLKCLYKKTRSG